MLPVSSDERVQEVKRKRKPADQTYRKSTNEWLASEGKPGMVQ